MDCSSHIIPFIICKSHHDECDNEFGGDTDHQGEHDVRGSEGHDEDVGGAQLLGPEQHDRDHHQVGEQAHHNWTEDDRAYCSALYVLNWPSLMVFLISPFLLKKNDENFK